MSSHTFPAWPFIRAHISMHQTLQARSLHRKLGFVPCLVPRKQQRSSCCTRSLVNQIRTVKEQALREGNEDQVEQLVSILDALTACVSSLHERNHETLIHELLTIPIWKTCQVRSRLSSGCQACKIPLDHFH